MVTDLEWDKIEKLTGRLESCIAKEKPTYEQLGQEIGRLVATKQAQYGESFTVAPKILALLYPNGVQPKDYGTLLAVVRILDKLKRVATQHESDSEDHWRDVCGYALLMLARQEGVERPGTYTQADLDAAVARAEARLLKLVVR
jgi:hypothetical protein